MSPQRLPHTKIAIHRRHRAARNPREENLNSPMVVVKQRRRNTFLDELASTIHTQHTLHRKQPTRRRRQGQPRTAGCTTIHHHAVADDFVVDGRYVLLDDSEFMKTIKHIDAGIADHDCVIKFGSYMNSRPRSRRLHHRTHRNAVPIHETNTVERTENPWSGTTPKPREPSPRKCVWSTRSGYASAPAQTNTLTFRSLHGLLSRVYLFVCLFICLLYINYHNTIVKTHQPSHTLLSLHLSTIQISSGRMGRPTY
jgi:hypothetical protein